MTARPRLIGLLGRKRSGKDTFASELVESLGFARVAFADPLKATMLELDPIVEIGYGYGQDRRLREVVEEEGWEEAKELPEVRRLLQAHGVAIRNAVGEGVWVDAAFREVERHAPTVVDDPGMPVVITDVRFPNEAARIRKEGGKLVRITRPGLESTDTHISEVGLDGHPVDAEVTNDGTVDDLRWKALDLVNSWTV